MSNELEAFLEYISVTRALSKKTVLAYASDLVLIENSLDNSLLALDTKAIVNLLAQHKNKRTLNRKLSSLNAFFDFCHKSNFLENYSKIKLSKLPKLLPKFLSYEKIKSSLNLIDTSTWIGKRDYALILFLYASGTRITECLELSHGDIDTEWLHIRHAKGEKERIVPLAKQAKFAIQEYLDTLAYEKDFIWVNYKGDKLSRISAYKITKKYLGVSPHVLRHSYATALISGGADLRVVQELLGHASLLSTQIYTHIQKQDLKDTLDVCHPLNS
ncbi:MAG: tyrosine-type recombinase/integrase [Sulfurimonas sp.]|nr:tyrosine-type recombinase/integrase [Sulfurimonas sp.]MDQ7061393.1 tyrosine-type recombinase/integrase [Sulfurimonas sp.]